MAKMYHFTKSHDIDYGINAQLEGSAIGKLSGAHRDSDNRGGEN